MRLSEKMEQAIMMLAAGGHSVAEEDNDMRTMRALINRGLVEVYGGQGLALTPLGHEYAMSM